MEIFSIGVELLRRWLPRLGPYVLVPRWRRAPSSRRPDARVPRESILKGENHDQALYRRMCVRRDPL
jgi:hypothetical protein